MDIAQSSSSLDLHIEYLPIEQLAENPLNPRLQPLLIGPRAGIPLEGGPRSPSQQCRAWATRAESHEHISLPRHWHLQTFRRGRPAPASPDRQTGEDDR